MIVGNALFIIQASLGGTHGFEWTVMPDEHTVRNIPSIAVNHALIG